MYKPRRTDPTFLVAVVGLVLIVMAGLADNPWIVWPTLTLAAIAASGVIMSALLAVTGRWRLFDIRYLDPNSDLSQGVPEYTAMSIRPGEQRFWLSVRAKRGLTITGISPTLFYGSHLPLPRQHGSERGGENFDFVDMTYRIGGEAGAQWPGMTPEHSEAGRLWRHNHDLGPGRRVIYGGVVNVGESLGKTHGLLSFEILFKRGGDPDNRRVRLPVYVASDDSAGPKRWRLLRRRKVLSIPPSTLGTEDSQSEGAS